LRGAAVLLVETHSSQPDAMWIICVFVNIGMWFERANIFMLSLENDHMPGAWGMWVGTTWDWMVVAGSFGWFMFLFLLYCKTMPTIAIAEIKSMLINPAGKPKTPAVEGEGHHHG
jgi:hypothetical protein